MRKAFQFNPSRIERYIVARYDSTEGGHFRAHRDNTTRGTAHRRFAITINLNDDFDGGELWFPEFGSRRYRPPMGGAVVFSCSLLHEATPVMRGVRYATLPFLYDDAAAKLREENNRSSGRGWCRSRRPSTLTLIRLSLPDALRGPGCRRRPRTALRTGRGKGP